MGDVKRKLPKGGAGVGGEGGTRPPLTPGRGRVPDRNTETAAAAAVGTRGTGGRRGGRTGHGARSHFTRTHLRLRGAGRGAEHGGEQGRREHEPARGGAGALHGDGAG
jgi:hypothetical protein